MNAPSRNLIAPEEVRSALERVLASREFAPGARAARFLRYIVEEALAGRSDRLKEFTVGVEVFDRDAARFDPRTDPIVRVEARRMRDKLAAFYRGEGSAQPVTIALPKGSYIPTWERAAPAAAKTAASGGVVVLPFVNLTGEARYEPFADALTDEITDALVKLPGLKVVARTSAFHFKGRNIDIRAIGVELNVDAVLEGSIQVAGERMKVIAQLCRTSDGFHIWSSIYEAQLGDPFAVQADIARHVTRTLASQLPEAQAVDPEKRRPREREAWEAYARATYHLRKVSPDNYREAFAMAQRVVKLDPSFARGHALMGAARFLFAQTWASYGITDSAIVDEARGDLLRALELDPDLGSAQATLAKIEIYHDFDWPAACARYERALALAPGVADVHAGYGVALGMQRRFADAKRHIVAAMEMDPLSLVCRLLLAHLDLWRGEFASAIARFDSALAMEPGNLWAVWPRCLALLHAGDLDRATAETTRLAASEPNYPHPRLLLAVLDARARGAKGAIAAIDAEAARSEARHWPYAFATAYALAGRQDPAFEWLEKARIGHDSNMPFIHVEHAFTALRADPRFAALISRMPGLALLVPGELSRGAEEVAGYNRGR